MSASAAGPGASLVRGGTTTRSTPQEHTMKSLVLAVGVAAASLGFSGTASAQHGHYGGYHGGYSHGGYHHGGYYGGYGRVYPAPYVAYPRYPYPAYGYPYP